MACVSQTKLTSRASSSAGASNDARVIVRGVTAMNSPDPHGIVITERNKTTDIRPTPVHACHFIHVTSQHAGRWPRPIHRPDVGTAVRRATEKIFVIRTERRLHVERRVDVTMEHSHWEQQQQTVSINTNHTSFWERPEHFISSLSSHHCVFLLLVLLM